MVILASSLPAALFAGLFVCLFSQATAAGPDLTDAESLWLKAGWPVIAFARQQQLPVDIVVQPQPTPGLAPLAMGFVDGRCKLVLSMRGNPEADKSLQQLPEALVPAVIEATVAHEIGHCWRYVRGVWHTLPSGFVDGSLRDADKALAGDEELARLLREMHETRREEGYADLVGLAWTLKHHPAQYAQVHAWLTKLRDDQPMPGAHHDTRAWIRLAADGAALGAASSTADSPFEQVLPLWQG